jgi:hypothetical protein
MTTLDGAVLVMLFCVAAIFAMAAVLLIML